VERLAVGRLPWAVAVTECDEGEEVVVTHRLARLRPGGEEARRDGKEGWLTVLGKGERVLAPYDFGFPNALEGLAAAGGRIFVSHLLNDPEEPRDVQRTVSGALSVLPLSPGAGRRLHLNDADFSTPVNFPRAVAVTPDGKTAYLALAGTDAVMGIDLSQPERPSLLGFWPTGKNPRGVVLNREGTRAYVMNHLSRDVSVLNLEDTGVRPEIARIPVTLETLDPKLLRGKVLFNNANDPRISHLGWMSCASCHYDGGADGTTWLTPEGARQTMPLWNLEGTAPFHISATRDEIQDFEADIEGLMKGVGLAPGPAARLLGEPNGGKSSDLDALATFVLKGVRPPRAAKADEAASARGREVFNRVGCAKCHGGSAWTRSSLPGLVGTLAPDGASEVKEALHDVGTYNPELDILGKDGFDIPTLLGLHATAPYLHDGSAETLEEVLENARHVGSALGLEARRDLEAFLRGLDGETPPFP
jgi:hypothetical protein